MSAETTRVVNYASSCYIFFFMHLWGIAWQIPHLCDADCCATTAVLVFSYAKQIRKLINGTRVFIWHAFGSQNTCRKTHICTANKCSRNLGNCCPAASINFYFLSEWASLSNLSRWLYYVFCFFLCPRTGNVKTSISWREYRAATASL